MTALTILLMVIVLFGIAAGLCQVAGGYVGRLIAEALDEPESIRDGQTTSERGLWR